MANAETTPSERLVTFRVPAALAEEFSQAVKREDLDMSKVLRRYMREYVAQAGLRRAA